MYDAEFYFKNLCEITEIELQVKSFIKLNFRNENLYDELLAFLSELGFQI